MRNFSKLSKIGKIKRIFYSIGNFFKRQVWGGYHRGGINGLYHWVRCHTIHRYHLIDIRNADGQYKWGWIDRDNAMYLACFKLLCDFVENEDPEIGIRTIESYTYDGMHPDELPRIYVQLEREKEIRALHTWWIKERAEEWDACSELVRDFDWKFVRVTDSTYTMQRTGSTTNDQWEAYRKRRDELDAKEEEMLMRLMKIRQSLWT